jgi:hypothetical protein
MYSAQEIEIIERDPILSNRVLQQLINAMVSGTQLSIAEEDFVGSYLNVARNEDNIRLSLHDFPACQNFLFKRNYLIYQGNFDGTLPAKTPLGVIAESEVLKDVALLEKFYQEWLLIIKKENHSERLLQYVGQETRNQLKANMLFASKANYSSDFLADTEKSVILHSKYFFYKVKKYFQEIGRDELVVDYCGHKIVIDGFAHFHILFRHYAKDIKPYQTDASYHQDQSIDPDILPTELGIIIDDYFDTVRCQDFNLKRLYVEINNVLYLIWFRPITQYKAGKSIESVLRLQTFYPVVAQNDLDFVSKLTPMESKEGRKFFI